MTTKTAAETGTAKAIDLGVAWVTGSDLWARKDKGALLDLTEGVLKTHTQKVGTHNYDRHFDRFVLAASSMKDQNLGLERLRSIINWGVEQFGETHFTLTAQGVERMMSGDEDGAEHYFLLSATKPEINRFHLGMGVFNFRPRIWLENLYRSGKKTTLKSTCRL